MYVENAKTHKPWMGVLNDGYHDGMESDKYTLSWASEINTHTPDVTDRKKGKSWIWRENMEFDQFSEAISKAASRLGNYWEVKIIASGMLAAAQFHLELVSLFVILIVIDLATKWIELAHNTIKTDDYTPSLVESIKAIPQAHRMGVISSKAMKVQFCGKIIVYVIVVMAGSIMDTMTEQVHRFGLVMPLCVSYLAASEFLSIIENLDDAGISAVHNLAALVKRKGQS